MNENETGNQYYKLPRWIIAVLIISLGANMITYSRVGSLKQEIRNIQNNINSLNHSINGSVSNNMYQINEALKRDASIITEFKYEFGEYKDKRMDLLLHVKPKAYTKGDKLYFSYKVGNESPILIEAQSEDNINFTSNINMSIMDNIDIDFVIDNGASRKVEKMENIYSPAEKFKARLSAQPSGGAITYDKSKSALVTTYYTFDLVDMEGGMDGYNLRDVKLSIMVNDKEIANKPIPNIDNNRYSIQLKDYEIPCKAGDSVDVYITAKDNKDLSYSALVETWKIGGSSSIEQGDKFMKMGIVEFK